MKYIVLTLTLSLLSLGCDALDAVSDAPTGDIDGVPSVVGCSSDADCTPTAPFCVCEPDSPDCTAGYCAPACVPQCEGRECGDDGCGGTCGTCETASDICDANGQCECIPGCLECGNDSCGGIGTCGLCADGYACITDENGQDGRCEVVSQGCEGMADGTPCSDGDLCTVDDQCSAGVCRGAAKDCSVMDIPCEAGTCAPQDGECVSVPVVDGTVCDDGALCTEAEGSCLAGACISAPLDCDDNNPCTDDICDPEVGCIGIPSLAPCEDGSLCTQFDVCDAGVCKSGQTIDCDDNNPCTDDSCDPAVGCIATPNEGDCDDGDPSTNGESCNGEGECVAPPAGLCGDGIVNGVDECDDNNVSPGDGCAADCTIEDGYTCSGSPSVCCELQCDGKTCGEDGCGGSCGVCGPNESCSDDGQCECAPSCLDKTCGSDGCGGTCGVCADNEVCSVAGACVCVPDCSGKACGDDGCGDTCGVCDDNQSCDEGLCVDVVETVDVAFSVDMNCAGIDAFTTVFVTGPWADWCGDCFALSDEDLDGVWTGSFPFEVGALVEYKFLVDNWADQETLYDDMAAGASCAPVTDYSSFGNRQVVAEAGASTTDTYGSCAACGVDVPGVTFSVDMTCSGLDAFTTVYVTGPWANWCGDCYAMSDEDGDGVWSTTLALDPGTVVEYKYLVDNWASSEDLVNDMVNGGTCAPVTDYFEYANRTVTVPDGAPILVQDVYGSCFACDCEGSCDGLDCGGDGCGDSCGLCDEGLSCEQGQCVSPPACDPPCAEGEFCGEGDVCVPDGPPVCDEPCADGQLCVDGACVAEVLGCMDDDANNFATNANVDDGSCVYEISLDFGGVSDCGFVSATGSWDGWTGWGATTDNGLKVDLAPGDYEFIILCVDTDIPNWWDNIWGAATILRPEPACAANEQGEPNYGFTVGEAPATINVCAGTCDSKCPEDDVPGCIDPDASNHAPAATIDDGSCQYEVTFDIDGMADCGYVSITGTWDSWSGWGAHTDTNLTTTMAPGDYQFVILCVDTNVVDWSADIWGASNVLRPTLECAANDQGALNYGFSLGAEPMTVSYCAGTCEPGCDAPVVEDVPGCIDPDASNHSPDATTDDDSCVYAVTFDLGGVEDCGFLSVTGTWDEWTGWGATTDTNMTVDLAPGDYEFIILCVDNTVDGWWNNIWGHATILRPEPQCAANDQGEPNYGLTVTGQQVVQYCAGSCGLACFDNQGPALMTPDDDAHGPSDGGECNALNCVGEACCCSYCANPCSAFGAPEDTEAECGACSPPESGGTAACYPGGPGYGATTPSCIDEVVVETVLPDDPDSQGTTLRLNCWDGAQGTFEAAAYTDPYNSFVWQVFTEAIIEPMDPEGLDADFAWATYKLVGTLDNTTRRIVYFTDPTAPSGQLQMLGFNNDFSVFYFDTGIRSWGGSQPGPNATNPDDAAHGPADGSECAAANCVDGLCCCSYCANSCAAFGAPADAVAECAACSPPEAGGAAACYPGAPGYGVAGCMEPGATNFNNQATSDDGLCLFEVVFDIDGVGDCGFVSVTGSFDDWSGWGANEDTNFTVALGTGAYEYVVLCVDTDVPEWWKNIWGAATVLRPEAECAANDGPEFNYGLTVSTASQVVSICATSCDAKCNGGQDIPGCTNLSASNYNVSATVDDGSCTFDVSFDLGGLESCGFVSVTGTFDGWSGWGATSDTNMQIELDPGDYEFVILCVDTTIPSWFDNIWASSTVYRPTVECAANTGGEPNYGFTLSEAPLTVSYCAGSCDAVCAPVDYALCDDAPGRTVPVTIDGRNLVVDGSAIYLKGVAWSPTALGAGPGTGPDPFATFVDVDVPLMVAAGINVVRTYGPIIDTAVLDTLYANGIYVLMTVYYGYSETPQSAAQTVCGLKSHPAIIGWLVGNEWNYNNLGLNDQISFTEAVDRVAKATEAIKQNDSSRPVSTIYGGIPDVNVYNALSKVDIWGLNIYTGASFGDLFATWGALSGKPMFFGEYGADAYNGLTDSVDEAMQATLLESQTSEIYANAAVTGGVCAGGTVFEWNDEWWKYAGGSWSEHDTNASWDNGAYPDPGMHEEWWGLVDIERNTRQAYDIYAGMTPPTP